LNGLNRGATVINVDLVPAHYPIPLQGILEESENEK